MSSPAQTAALWDQVRLHPLDSKRIPGLLAALSGLTQLLADGGQPPKAVLGAPSPQRWLAQFASLQAVVDAGWLLQADLQAACAELPVTANEQPMDSVIDQWLLPEILHGIAAMRPLTPDMPEAWRQIQAASWAVDAWRPLCDASMAEEPPAVGRPQWLVHLPPARWVLGQNGLEAVIAYGVGKGPQPAGVAAWLASGAAVLQQPAGESGDFAEHEAAWLEDVVLCVHHRRQRTQGWPAMQAVPPKGGLRWDTGAAVFVLPGAGTETLLQRVADGWLDPLPAQVPAPPAASKRLLQAGWKSLQIVVDDTDALDDLLDALFEVCEEPPEPQDMEGDGFSVRVG